MNLEFKYLTETNLIRKIVCVIVACQFTERSFLDLIILAYFAEH